LGVLTVAAPLVAQGVEVVILDERVEPAFDELLTNALAANPVCAGISSMSGRHITGALRISKLVKDHSDVPVVWGGVQASLEPKSTINHPLVDYIVRDDGEESFPSLVEAISNGLTGLDAIPGVAYKKSGIPVFTADPQPADISKLPLIPFQLIDWQKYRVPPGGRDELWTSEPRHIIPMETSRGCPFSCIFCTESARKKKWRSLPPERVVEDIKTYRDRYNIRNFTFIDDNLFGDIRRGERLIEMMASADLGINWYTNLRTDYMSKASPEFLARMESSGCRMLTFGAESGSERVLKMINKKASAEHVLEVNRRLARSNIIPHFVTIRGFPTESAEEMQQTYRLLCDLILANPKTICDSPQLITTPGTKIAEMCLGDLTHSYTLEDWAEVFDLFAGKKPDWVMDETWNFLRDHDMLLNVMYAASSPEHGIKRRLGRILLSIYARLLASPAGGRIFNSMLKTLFRQS
jgi:radical SAM superfamily enzyme YgiQ (UPF0313 family)